MNLQVSGKEIFLSYLNSFLFQIFYSLLLICLFLFQNSDGSIDYSNNHLHDFDDPIDHNISDPTLPKHLRQQNTAFSFS